MAIDPEVVREVGVSLVGDVLLPKLEGYGENAGVTGLVLVASVRVEASADSPVPGGNTITCFNIAHGHPGTTDEMRFAHLVEILEAGLRDARGGPYVDLADLPPLPDFDELPGKNPTSNIDPIDMRPLLEQIVSAAVGDLELEAEHRDAVSAAMASACSAATRLAVTDYAEMLADHLREEYGVDVRIHPTFVDGDIDR
jgi:hypothetical protein